MNDYNEPPEPTEEELDQYAAEQSMKENNAIAITGLRTSDVDHMLRTAIEHALSYRVAERIDSMIEETIEKVVDEKAKAITEELVGREVSKVIAEGWTEHDRWGNKGKTHTLRDMIASYFQTETVDRYGDKAKTPVARAIQVAVTETIKTDFEPVLEAAKRKLAEQLDATVLASVAETVRSALGLKR